MSYLSNSLLTYSPLEIVSPNGMYIGPEVDIWSMGCVLYVITTGRLPFLGMPPSFFFFFEFTTYFIPLLGHSANATRELIMKGTFSVPYHISGDLKSLICSMLNVDPKKRFTIDQVVCILSSPQKGKKILLCFV